ncbi:MULTISPECIES: AzlC family ABC transporter permease [unclassified Pseudomonas]|jgi:4-azaleucine resistance transporter AzlC|uniref:AzlC family ABC transporter permease n=1 Tax=unclassified Pseudomonas TaxID=196821 RepID=UPI0011995F5E|nr:MULTISPECIES: AzlC family ABC transporter permease [unclassified Pseudomonas]TWC11654.1 4-azaleucine resistance transporter AzlC [Pseudomonas sp. SJZ075]TWC21432.1 4-azaleucine resistance transporter AzlC [Pseudomonas sp. SJZ074]TWC28205.1 4-azaleucine resistance transporter AzlC [Pseudomonas sp. SJZ078]TWC39069.1 4-azaleucine resistance transporter AzlC [Pseudomonas sp. SJZ085]TWC48234.1 4-azaleucine resistance transporter AzlC [Pseudomonas sp. SJZ124]
MSKTSSQPLVVEPQASRTFAEASPVVAGYFTVSFVFGLMAVNAGLPLWLPVAMCLFVYAGASQFAALALISSGASLTTIVLTTFLINARHMLMSVYMAKALRTLGLSRFERWCYASGLTDESFAFHSVKLGSGAPVSVRYLIGFNLFCHTSWVLGGLLGAVCAQYAAHLIKYQLDYALTAMMLYVLVSLCNTRNKLIAALAAVVCMGVLSLLGTSPFNVFIATFVGCGVGVCLTKRS